MKNELAGRVALVTGSARNIGRAIALSLAQGGASVMVTAKQAAAEAEAVAEEIRGFGGRAASMIADVGDPASAASLVRTTVEKLGRLDILVNNASVRREVDFADLEYDEWREIMGITLDGAYLCSRAAMPHLIAADGGSIVNIGGLSAHTGATRRAHVIAAKMGLVGLTRALAHDLAKHNVTVNCVAPGLIDTTRVGAEPAHHAGKMPPLGRKGTPEEIGSLVRFLCGPDARYITGQTIHSNGGLFM
ncbi:MAG: 3-oxoacyl-ACP reductase FabG [Acidobacteria bacterium]|nr:3-oxoacyl-ACP reductase FabG [Acidobacteriota bacterium]